ncbi:uncharacterized protein LOC134666964 [Cydia fagiglandana]|uniref:uncharacterized protein LOC134666964 n=1 Tax=Cydia fagiglandana TaxID=1458189 RepID=UPI002FEE3C71
MCMSTAQYMARYLLYPMTRGGNRRVQHADAAQRRALRALPRPPPQDRARLRIRMAAVRPQQQAEPRGGRERRQQLQLDAVRQLRAALLRAEPGRLPVSGRPLLQASALILTVKIVPRFTELLVFYGSEFANRLCVDLRRYTKPCDCEYCQAGLGAKKEPEKINKGETSNEKKNETDIKDASSGQAILDTKKELAKTNKRKTRRR